VVRLHPEYEGKEREVLKIRLRRVWMEGGRWWICIE